MANPDPRDTPDTVPITVELFVPDVEASVRFYMEKLGFSLIRMERGELAGEEGATFAVISLARAVILIAQESLGALLSLPPGAGGGLSIRIMVKDVDAVYERVRENGVPIVADIGDRDYGLRDFSLRDADGFHLRFASPLS